MANNQTYEKICRNDRKDNSLRVSRNKSNKNETNIYKTPKGIIQKADQISKTRKEISDKEGGSTDSRELNQTREKVTSRHGEKKCDNYSQNDSQNKSKLTEKLRTRSINKEIKKKEIYS